MICARDSSFCRHRSLSDSRRFTKRFQAMGKAQMSVGFPPRGLVGDSVVSLRGVGELDLHFRKPKPLESSATPLHVVSLAAILVIKTLIYQRLYTFVVVEIMPGISQMNKVQLVSEIQRLGGTADLTARKLELQQQLYDLNAENGVTSGSRAVTDYQNYTRAMNKAGKYKKDLIAYMQEHLNLAVSSNSTQIQLQKQALQRIYELSKIDETDPVGFGAHGSLSYRELLETQPSYCQWAQTTANEGQCNPLMTRLVQWLEQEKSAKATSAVATTGAAANKMKSTAVHGRRKEIDQETASASSHRSSGMQEQVMMEMMGALKGLQAEVAALKEDRRSSRPRKEKHTDEEMDDVSGTVTEGSYVAVKTPTKGK